MEFWPAFIIGLFGSLHCIGMCGPIVLALPSDPYEKMSFFWGRLIYNTGRILTYTFIGMVFGLFGGGIAMAGFQQDLSIVLGGVVLFGVIFSLRLRKQNGRLSFSNLYISKIKGLFSKLLNKRSKISMLLLGILNGFLPCGLVYIAIAGATATASPGKAALFMASFGVGTLPLMFAASLFGSVININIRRRLNRLLPVFAALLAVLLILRGLNLGIPYVSPKLSVHAQVTKADCCE